MKRLLIIALLVSPRLWADHGIKAKLVDGVAAIVDRTVITFSELWLEARLERIRLVGNRGLRDSLSSDELKRSLTKLIDETKRADRLRLVSSHVTEAMIETKVAGIKNQFPQAGQLKEILSQCNADEATLKSIAKRRLYAALSGPTLDSMPNSQEVRVFPIARPPAGS